MNNLENHMKKLRHRNLNSCLSATTGLTHDQELLYFHYPDEYTLPEYHQLYNNMVSFDPEIPSILEYLYLFHVLVSEQN